VATAAQTFSKVYSGHLLLGHRDIEEQSPDWICCRRLLLITSPTARSTEPGTTAAHGSKSVPICRPATIIIQELIINPTNPAVLYGHSYDAGLPPPPCRFIKSVNSGTNWTEVAPGTLRGQIFDVAMNPTNSLLMYAFRREYRRGEEHRWRQYVATTRPASPVPCT